MAWWSANKMRLIQNNLRETDADLDVDRLIEDLNALSTNVLIMNAGGIVAFYPTQLEYHYRAANQQKDLLKEAVEKAHASGMKFIARFDFSKAHETIFNERPEWFYRTANGKEVNYYGIVHTCINGYYQCEYSLQMIDEVISNYEVDGIFFNMFGYQTRDYSGTDHGICCCDNCKLRFKEWCGMELPQTQSMDDPLFRAYKQFQDMTTKEMLNRIHKLVKSKNREIAISTYNEHRVDIVRKESNSDPARPHPVWLYSASENVKSLEDSWEDKLVSNCCINAVDLIHRFTGVSKHEVNIRLKENLASGSGLDFCIIGVFEDYPDRENLAAVAEIYKFHKEHEQYYGNFLSMADVVLIKPAGPSVVNMKEYSGLFKMLKEQHILFDVLDQQNLVLRQDALRSCKAVFIPDMPEMTAPQLEVLEALYLHGVTLIGTGRSFTAGGENQAFLKRVFDVGAGRPKVYERDAAYVKTADKRLFKRFAERDWIIVKGAFQELEFGEQAQRQLPFVIPSTFGPPERASGHRISEEVFGTAVRTEAHRRAVFIPWQPGELYLRYGYSDHKHAVMDLLDEGMPNKYTLTTNAPQSIEIFFNKLDDHTFILHLLNLSGFNGVSYFEPVPMRDLAISLHGIGACRQLEKLGEPGAEGMSFSNANEDITLHFHELRDFAAVVITVE